MGCGSLDTNALVVETVWTAIVSTPRLVYSEAYLRIAFSLLPTQPKMQAIGSLPAGRVVDVGASAALFAGKKMVCFGSV